MPKKDQQIEAMKIRARNRERFMQALGRLATLAFVLGVAYLVRLVMQIDVSRYYEKPNIAFSFVNMNLRMRAGEDMQWEAVATSVEVDRDERFYTIDEITELYLHRKDKPPLVYKKRPGEKGPGGLYDSTTKKLSVSSKLQLDFVAENGDEMLLSCDKSDENCIEWDGRRELATVPAPAQLTLDDNRLHSDTLEINQRSDLYLLRGNVDAFIPDLKNNKSRKIREEFEESEIDENYGRDLHIEAAYIRYDERVDVMNCYANEGGIRPNIEQDGSPASFQPQRSALPKPPAMSRAPEASAGGLPLPAPGGGAGVSSLPDLPPAPAFDWRWAYLKGSHQAPPPKSDESVRMYGERFEMTAAVMDVYFKNKYVQAIQDVRITRFADEPNPEKSDFVQSLQKKESTYYADEAFHYWKEGRFLIPGETLIQTKDFTVLAGQAIINTKQETSLLSNGVQLNQDSGQWMADDDLVKPSSEKSKEIVQAPTLIDSASVSMNFEKETIDAVGDVVLRQEGRTLTGERAFYNKEDESWTITGDPRGVDEDDIFDASKIVFYPKTNEMAAEDVASVFKADDEYAEDIADYFRERDGKDEEDDAAREPDFVRQSSLEQRSNDDTQIVEMNGEARIQIRDFVATSDRMEIDRNNKVARLFGSVRTEDKAHWMEAENATVYWGEKWLEAEGGVTLRYKGREKTEKRKKRDPFTLTCQTLRHNWDNEAGEAQGDAHVEYDDRDIASRRMTFDNDAGTAEFFDDVHFHQDNGNWLKETGRFEEKDDDDDFWKIAKKGTWIDAGYMFADDENDYLKAVTRVVARQEFKTLEADVVEVWDADKKARAEGNVLFKQTTGQWLFDDGLVEEDEDDRVNERLKKAADIQADLLESDYENNVLHLKGSVRINQKNAFANGDEFWRDGNLKKTVFLGNVEIRDEDARFLRGQKLIYYSNTRTFEAYGAVEGKDFVDTENKERVD